jgi:hypothetical protein
MSQLARADSAWAMSASDASGIQPRQVAGSLIGPQEMLRIRCEMENRVRRARGQLPEEMLDELLSVFFAGVQRGLDLGREAANV